MIHLKQSRALCWTPAAAGLTTGLFLQQIKHNKVPPKNPPQTSPRSDASLSRTAATARPLHDKVQSRIIKLEKDRDRKKLTQTSNGEKRPCEGEDSAEWKWCQLLNLRSEENSPCFLAHTHNTPPPHPFPRLPNPSSQTFVMYLP